MNARLRATAEALPVLIPVAVIVIGVVTGDGWLRTIGMWGLAAVIVLALLRGDRFQRLREAIPAWSVGLALFASFGVILAAMLADGSPPLLLVVVLAISLACLILVIARLVYGLIRVYRGA